MLGMSGDEQHAVRVVAVRERHAQRRGGGQPRGDAADDAHVDAGFVQGLQLLAAAAEDERIAALEAHDLLALARRRHHQLVDEALRRAAAAAALAHVDDARAGRGERHDLGADEVVHQQHGGGPDRLDGLEGEQFGVAGAGADEGDRGGMVHGEARRKMCSTWAAMAAGTGLRPASTSCV